MSLYSKIQTWLVEQATGDDSKKIALYRRAGQIGSTATFYRFVAGQPVVPGADKVLGWMEKLGFRVLFPGENMETQARTSDAHEICGRIFQKLNAMGVDKEVIVAAQQAVFEGEETISLSTSSSERTNRRSHIKPTG